MNTHRRDWLRAAELAILFTTAVILLWQVYLVRQELEQARLQHKESARETRIDRSAKWVDEISGNEVLWDKLFATRNVASDPQLSEEEKIARISSDQKLTTDLQYVLARFETLGVQYNMDGLDRAYIRRTMGPALVDYFDRCFFYIDLRRRGGRPTLYKEYEAMVTDLRK